MRNCINRPLSPVNGMSFSEVCAWLRNVVSDDAYDFDWDGTFGSCSGEAKTAIFIDKTGIDEAVSLLDELVQYENLYDISPNRDLGMQGLCIVFKKMMPGYDERVYCKIFLPDNGAVCGEIIIGLHD